MTTLKGPSTGRKKSEQASISPAKCSELVMDSVPTVMRFVRCHIKSGPDDTSSVAQVRALYFLKTSPRSSLTELARFMNVTKATASNMVGRMVEKGWVERVNSPEERRCVELSITAGGMEQYNRLRGKALAAVTQRLSYLSAEELERVADGLTLLQEAFLK